MNNKMAKRFFFRPQSYFSLALPSYFQFDRVLNRSRELLAHQSLRNFYIRGCHPRCHHDINYSIYYNKDGKYAWRKYQLIHPFIYTEMIHLLTDIENWNFVKSRVKELSHPLIACTSMLPAPTSQLNRNEQDIFNWAGNFTNETVRHALKYKYMFVTDITNCYDTIPFYLLRWALYGRNEVNTVTSDLPMIGYQVCTLLEDMTHGAGQGIPQGSVVMDYLAEIALNYIDSIISRRIGDNVDVHILRYRDDYRIFTNETRTACMVMKIIVETLAEFDLKINLSKTHATSDVIKNAFKPDRLAWKTIQPLIFGENKLSILKMLLLIQDFSHRYPNCGSLKNALATLYEREIYDSSCHDDVWQVISVIGDIMYANPGVWPQCVAILSKYIEAHKNLAACDIVEKLRQKFLDIPCSEYLDIWLQRLTIKEDPYYEFSSPLCRTVYDHESKVWNSEWLGMYTGLHDSDIITYNEVLAMSPAISTEEVALFIKGHNGSSG